MRILRLLAVAGATIYLAASCANSAEKDGLGHHHHHHGHEQVEENAHDHHGGEITLEPQTAAKMGVVTNKAVRATFHEVVKVSGQIEPSPDDRQTVSATSSGIVTFGRGIAEGAEVKAGQTIASISSKGLAGGDTNAAARTAVDAAKRELDRLTPLHREGIVSTKDYNAARAAYEQARAAYSGNPAGGAATARRGGVISRLLVKPGEYVNTGQPIAEVSGNQRLTLRADVPGRYRTMLPTIKSANFRTAYSDTTYSLSALDGRIMTNGTTGGTEGGYTAVYFTLNNNGDIAPGAFADVYLIGNERQGVIAVPAAAITEQQGNHFVYVRLDEDCYEKRLVSVGGSDGQNVEIVNGINEGDDVVVAGATVVKLAESNGVVPEGHSHNH